jgi:hypothetical protein
MPRHAIAHLGEAELRMSEPASAEEMEQRKRVAALLRAKMAKPATESDRALWQEFLDLGQQRLTFRS